MSTVVEGWGNVGDAGSIGVFQGAVRRVANGFIVFHALHGSGISTALFLEIKVTDSNITPLHVKVYIRLGRASFRFRYQEWKQERKRQAAQVEAATALEVEQLRSLYQAEGRISPPEDAVI